MKINPNKTIGILGSGFGLYGYLVALREAKLKNKIYTLLKYKKLFIKRNDLAKHYKNVFFCNNEKEIIKRSYYLIFAKRPLDQEKFIKKILKLNKNLFLEKPLASTPEKSLKLIKILIKKKIKFKIGFLFYYLNWFQKLIKSKKKNIRIKWNFYSSDLKKKKYTWKINDKIPGGGLINFYGIHFIFLITFLGKIKKIKSKLTYNKMIQPVKWNLDVTFNTNNKFIIKISIDKKINLFKITTNNKKDFYKAKNPFDISKFSDLRVKPLISHFKNEKMFYKNYLDHINVWKMIINATEKEYEKN